MQPDFKTLKPIQDIQPDFATLKPITPLQQQVESLPKSTMFSDLTTLYGGGEQGIAQRLGRDISQGASDIQKGFESGTVKGIAEGLVKGTTKSAFRTAGDVAGAIYAPLTSGLNALSGGLFNKFFEGVNKSLAEGKAGPASWIVDKVSNIPEFQQFAMEHPNAGEDFGRALNLVFAKGDLNKDVSRAFTEPQAVVKEATNQIYKTVANTPTQIKNTIQNTFKNTPEDIINKRTNELNKIDNQYAQLRKASGYSKDNGIESRRRVASTDVLADAVDETGTIRTQGKNGPIEQYKALTLENGENVVKNNLERLGEKVSLKEVQTRLENSVKNSGLEGADLQIALDKIPKEISGLSLKADANGDIPLSVLQDAKISTTKQINYQTPPEVNTYRKSIASAYRDTIEKNSSLNVREVNEELSKYLSDIAFLERLDGKKVSGGKLGKYFAQISGNIIGGATGGAVGGPVGSALGTVIGGEVAGRIKGKLLSKSLGGNANLPTEQSSVIRNAIKQSKLPRLALPEPKQGSPRLRMESTGNPIQLPAEGRTLLGIEEIYSNN